MGEFIFMDIDPSFEIVLRAVAELRSQNRLSTQFMRRSTIERVKSASNENSLIFGNLNALARRLNLCARICMAHSAGMDPRFWRVSNCYDRNLDDSNFNSEVLIGSAFNLAANNKQAKYSSEYDRLYPHFIIEERLKDNLFRPQNVFIPSTMLIIRQNFSEIIEIDTTMHIFDQGPVYEQMNFGAGRYECRISVVTTQATVAVGPPKKFFRVLQALCICHSRTKTRAYAGNWRMDELSALINESPVVNWGMNELLALIN